MRQHPRSSSSWRDKTKGLSNLVMLNNARVVDGWMKMLGS